MNYISYRKGYKYQLADDYSTQTALRPVQDVSTPYVSLSTDGTLTVRAGYAWDGASGPTWDSKSALRASLEHDAKLQLVRLGLLPRWNIPTIHDEFYATLITDGMMRIRARVWWMGVRRFGMARPSSEPIVYRAP